MKKLFVAALLAIMSFSANAQFYGGMAFDINYSGDSDKPANSSSALKGTETYGIALSPQFAYAFSEKSMAGVAINFDWTQNRENSNIIDELTGATTTATDITKTMGWSVAPFYRYKLMDVWKFGVWADLHAFYGMKYPSDAPGFLAPSYKKAAAYGVQLCPMVSIPVNDKMSVNLHVSILSLGWAGSATYNKDNSVSYTSTARLFSGKITGVLNSLVTSGWYGFKISMLRKF